MSRTWLRFLPAVVLLGVPALVAGPAAGQTISEGGATTEVDASGGAPGLGGALGDSLVTVRATLPVGPVMFDPDAPERLALPPGVTVPARTTGTPSGSPAQEEPPTVWRVGDEMPFLRFPNLAPGPDHGFANRFDPADLADVPGGKPRGVRIRKIHFIVNGQKRFVVAASGADFFVVYCKTDPQGKPHERISLILIEAEREGVKVGHLYNLLGTRGGGTGSYYQGQGR